MKLFLDDVRNPRDCYVYMYTRIGRDNQLYFNEWTVVRSYDEFVKAVQTAHDNNVEITHVSFDHDLADEHYDPTMDSDYEYNKLYESFAEKTGYECAKFLKEMYKRQGKPLPKIFVHSMNPVGVKNIQNVFG